MGAQHQQSGQAVSTSDIQRSVTAESLVWQAHPAIAHFRVLGIKQAQALVDAEQVRDTLQQVAVLAYRPAIPVTLQGGAALLIEAQQHERVGGTELPVLIEQPGNGGRESGPLSLGEMRRLCSLAKLKGPHDDPSVTSVFTSSIDVTNSAFNAASTSTCKQAAGEAFQHDDGFCRSYDW